MCAAGGRCVAAACTGFEESTPCFREEGPGFCAAGACQAAVDIAGRLTDFPRSTPGLVAGARIEALDRAWMDLSTSDDFGEFHIPAVPGDQGLQLEVRANGFLPLRTRAIDLSSGDYVINGSPTQPLRLLTDDEAVAVVEVVTSSHDRGRGYVGVVVGADTIDGYSDLGGATVTLTGDGRYLGPVYFMGGNPAPSRTTTSATNGTTLFVEVEPGAYTLTVDRPMSAGCAAAGDDAPTSIPVTVAPDVVTWVGWVLCTQAQ
jgi:hypothetical protein